MDMRITLPDFLSNCALGLQHKKICFLLKQLIVVEKKPHRVEKANFQVQTSFAKFIH